MGRTIYRRLRGVAFFLFLFFVSFAFGDCPEEKGDFDFPRVQEASVGGLSYRPFTPADLESLIGYKNFPLPQRERIFLGLQVRFIDLMENSWITYLEIHWDSKASAAQKQEILLASKLHVIQAANQFWDELRVEPAPFEEGGSERAVWDKTRKRKASRAIFLSHMSAGRLHETHHNFFEGGKFVLPWVVTSARLDAKVESLREERKVAARSFAEHVKLQELEIQERIRKAKLEGLPHGKQGCGPAHILRPETNGLR